MNPKTKKNWLKKRLVFFVIIFIIAILCVSFLPLTTHRSHCGNYCAPRLKQIGLGLKLYAMDFEEFFPLEDNAQGLDKLRELDYLTDYGIYVCPDSKIQKGTKGSITEQNCSYVYLGGFREGQNPQIPLVFDKTGNHPDIVGIVFIDGHVARYPASAIKSCEDIIIFLNKEHKYPNKLFKKLLSKAKKIDRILQKSDKQF